MAYPDELLAFAQDIASLHPDEAHQPSLRRAISTPHYALVHLLIADAVANCADAQLDPRPPEEPERTVTFHLHNVAETFSQAQHNRNEADYNLPRIWRPTQVSLLIEGVADAFKSWAIIREEAAARDHLVSILPSRERKQQEKQKPNKPRPTLTDFPK